MGRINPPLTSTLRLGDPASGDAYFMTGIS
jgi:hypothetical protein